MYWPDSTSVRWTYVAHRCDASLKSKEINEANDTIVCNQGIFWHMFYRLTIKGSTESIPCIDNEIYFFH